MSMKSRLVQLAALAALFNEPVYDRKKNLRVEDIDLSPKEPPKPNGLKKFNIGGKEVWAINEKNARRKAAK